MKDEENKNNENEIVQDLSDEQLEMNGGNRIPWLQAADQNNGSVSMPKMKGCQPPVIKPY